MSDLPPMTMSHIGIVVKDLARQEAFYTGEPGEHHRFVPQEGRPSDETTINQISFRLDNLDALRRIHRILLAAEVKEMRLVDHALSWSIYCHAPEGNLLEFSVDAPYCVHHSIIEPLDLTRSDEEIRQSTEKRFGGDPTFNSFENWKRGFARRLGEC